MDGGDRRRQYDGAYRHRHFWRTRLCAQLTTITEELHVNTDVFSKNADRSLRHGAAVTHLDAVVPLRFLQSSGAVCRKSDTADCKPLRRILPALGPIDTASLLLAFVLTTLKYPILLLIQVGVFSVDPPICWSACCRWLNPPAIWSSG